MRRLLGRLVIFAVVVGVAVKLLRSLGVMGGGECGPGCDCSMGATECRCGHRTCLAPATA